MFGSLVFIVSFLDFLLRLSCVVNVLIDVILAPGIYDSHVFIFSCLFMVPYFFSISLWTNDLASLGFI